MATIPVLETANALRKSISELSAKNVGFVPTMGALHQGHLSLVEKALLENDLVVVSIFVNPTQFNNQEDLEKYPRTLEADVDLLSTLSGTILVYAPTVKDVYPADYKNLEIDLGSLATVMEGEFRPGHFEGMINVVYRLFEIVKPQNAYFGLKDFQQLAIIKYMVKSYNLPINIIPCKIVREKSGLAGSSRNMRMSVNEKMEALALYRSLKVAKLYAAYLLPEECKQKAVEYFNLSGLKLEYFKVVHPETLQEITDWNEGGQACIAAYCGPVRLIDNLKLV